MRMKALLFSAVFTLIMFAASVNAFAGSDTDIDFTKADSGVVTIKYTGNFNKAIKVIVQYGETKYYYDIFGNDPVTLPLQMGNGNYTVGVYRNISGTSYQPIASETVNVANWDEQAVYLNSIQLVNFSADMNAIKGLTPLTKDSTDKQAKLNEIYNYIVSNVSYDYDKAAKAAASQLNGYLPVIDDTYKTNMGICFDYSSLFAAELRYLGIPAKLQMGYAAGVNAYHAWNEVCLNSKWYKIDTTFDATSKKYNMKFTQVKKDTDYTVSKQY